MMKRIIVSGVIGNALEWYDFILYAHFSYIIGKIFFPDNQLSSIFVFAVFAVGFFSRPLGGILFSNIGDRLGRRASLTVSILTMAVPTAIIGLLPGYEKIGIMAPIILIIMRLLQGLSLGGEFSGCVAYFVEYSPSNSRGLIGSFIYISQCIGMMFGLAVATVLTNTLNEKSLWDWGWRVPFVSGILIGVIGMYIRIKLEESPIYLQAKSNGNLSSAPITEAIFFYWRKILLSIGLYINVTAQFYAVTILMPNYMISIGYSSYQSNFSCSIALITMMLSFPISAYIADKIGRKPVIKISCVLLTILIYPTFLVINTMNYLFAAIAQVILSVVVAMHMAPVPALLSELFPTRIRLTGIALSSNLSAAIFGGTVPMVGEILYQLTNSNLSISYYLTALAVAGVLIISFYRETAGINLSEK